MRACPRPRSAFPRWWVGLGAAGKLPSKAVTFSLPGKPARHRSSAAGGGATSRG
jgi:hypothetical protein